MQTTLASVVKAVQSISSGSLHKNRAVAVEVVTIERANVTEIGLQQVGQDMEISSYYREVELRPDASTELHEAPTGLLVNLVKQRVEVEGPIHADEIVTRIRTAWGLQRAGSRIDAHVGNAIRISVNSGGILRSGEFHLWPGAPITLRDRSIAASPSLRRLDLLPPMEIEVGLKSIIGQSFGASQDEAVNAIARGLGFTSTSAQLREMSNGRIVALKELGTLEDKDGMLTAGSGASPE